MKAFIYWFFLLALIIIHTIDMELTTFEIGNQWEYESFLPMRLCIKYFGISQAVWISRVVMYAYFALSYKYRYNNYFLFIMFLFCCLYWTSMINWIFTLGIAEWPFKCI
jgi:hypothetical protein